MKITDVDDLEIAVNSVVSRTGTRLAPVGIDIPVNENVICVPDFVALAGNRGDTVNAIFANVDTLFNILAMDRLLFISTAVTEML